MSTPKKILVIDVEATCWENEKYRRNEIIEVGVSVIDIATHKIESSEGILVKPPTEEISPFCTTLTTLTPEYIAEFGINFCTANHVLLTKYGSSKNVFASWGDYDRKAFENNCKWNDVPYPFPNMHLNVKSLFAAKFGWNGGVEKCAAELGLPFEGTQHRGVDDSRMIARILRYLLWGTLA